MRGLGPPQDAVASLQGAARRELRGGSGSAALSIYQSMSDDRFGLSIHFYTEDVLVPGEHLELLPNPLTTLWIVLWAIPGLCLALSKGTLVTGENEEFGF